jgi:hypothetical protein
MIETKIKPFELEFEIPGLTKMSNQLLRGNWRTKHGHARKWKIAVLIAIGSNRPDTPIAKCRLKLTRCSARRPDYDGLVSGFKPIIDGLVEAGVLLNDSYENVDIPEYLHETCGAKDGKMRVRVIEVL